MFKIIGSHSCPNTLYVLNKCMDQGLKSGVDFMYVNISAGLAELRTLLEIRDKNEIFAPFRENGKIGIPCFVFEDGTVTFSYEEAIRKALDK